MDRLINKMDIMDLKSSFQELMKSKLVTFLKIEEITLSKLKPDTELVMLGVNMDMRNLEIQEEIHSRKLKENLKTKHSKVQESISIKSIQSPFYDYLNLFIYNFIKLTEDKL